jgi:hypothetical protein
LLQTPKTKNLLLEGQDLENIIGRGDNMAKDIKAGKFILCWGAVCFEIEIIIY